MIKCFASLAFYLFSPTSLIKSIKHEHSSKIQYVNSVLGDYPPECDAAVLTTRKSENMENTCFTIPSKCTEPVDSLPLRYEIDTTGNWGNGTQYFRLDVKEILDDMIGICTIGSLKNRYGTWVVSVKKLHLNRDMRFPTMLYVRPAKPQISLRICAV